MFFFTQWSCWSPAHWKKHIITSNKPWVVTIIILAKGWASQISLNPRWLGSKWGLESEILPSYIGIYFISHEIRIRINQTRISWFMSAWWVLITYELHAPGAAMSLWFFRGDAVGTAETNCTTATSLAVLGAGCLKLKVCGKMVKRIT